MLSTLQDVLQFAPELPRCVTDDLAAAQRDGERLLRMVDSLLEFARLDDGRQRLHYQPTDLAALTAEVACMFADAARAAGLTLTVDAPTLAEPVWVDPQIWEKVVAHLVSNALKFTWEGGVDVRLRALPKHVELLVRDSGVGIPTGQLSEVLKRFHQVPDSIGRSRGGVGIGLALVDEWVRRHHGRIRVTSAEGVGTTVTVWMPTGRRRASFSGNDEPATTGLVAAAMAAEARHWAEPREDAATDPPTVAQPVTAFGDDTSTA
jgi:signal transduction histidine kinase